MYKLYNHHVQMATEMSCFDSILRLDAVAMSEGECVMDTLLQQWFETDLIKRLASMTDIQWTFEDLEVSLLKGYHPNKVHVTFDYLYETHFLFKGYLSKWVVIDLSYELPINN